MSSLSSSSPPFFHASTSTSTAAATTKTSTSLVTPLSVPRAAVMKYVSTSPDHDTTTTSSSSTMMMKNNNNNSRDNHSSMVRTTSSSGSGSSMTIFTDTHQSINMPTDSSDDCYGSCNVKDPKTWDAHHHPCSLLSSSSSSAYYNSDPNFSSVTFSSSTASNLSSRYNDHEQLGVHCWTMNQKQEQSERLIPATSTAAAAAAAAAAPAFESHSIVLQTKQELPEKREYSVIALLQKELVEQGKLEPFIVQQEQQRQPQVQVPPEVQVQAESEAQPLSPSKTTEDLQSKPDPIHSDVSKKRKRWKKPAIKKPKRFGFPLALPPHGGYHSCTDSCSNSSSCESSHSSTRPAPPHQICTQTKQNKKQKQQKQDRKVKPKSKSNTKNLHTNENKKKKTFNNDSQKRNAQPNFSMTTTTKSKHPKRSNTKQGTDHASSKVAMTTATTSNSKKFVKMKSFDKRLEDLKVFRDEFGHCEVPYTYPPNQPLSNWCANLRYSYGQVVKGLTPTIKMTEERIDQLRQVGFNLEASTSIMNKNHKKQAQKKKKKAN